MCYLFLLSSRLLILFLCQLLWRLYCNSLTHSSAEVGIVWDRQGDWGRDRERDNESWWDLKGKGGVGKEKELSYSQRRGPNSCCCEPHFIQPPSQLSTRNLQILKSPRLPHGHMWGSSTTFGSPFTPDNRHRMPLGAAREKTLVSNSVDATWRVNTLAGFLTATDKNLTAFWRAALILLCKKFTKEFEWLETFI